MNPTWCLILVILTFSIGCSGDGATSSGTFSEIGDISVDCDSTDGGPAACNNTQSGKAVKLAWSLDTCAAMSIANIAAYEDTTLSCVAGVCSANDSVSWRSPSTGQIIYNISSAYRTGIAWLNLVNNGASDSSGPLTGDVFCCLENQSAHADMYSANCSAVP